MLIQVKTFSPESDNSMMDAAAAGQGELIEEGWFNAHSSATATGDPCNIDISVITASPSRQIPLGLGNLVP